jgi:hypothetical protein
MVSPTTLYDEYDPDAFDETSEELAYRLPGSYISPEIDRDDPMAR